MVIVGRRDETDGRRLAVLFSGPRSQLSPGGSGDPQAVGVGRHLPLFKFGQSI